MPGNITYGNVTEPVVSTFAKVDIATGGMWSLFIMLIVFVMIMLAFYRKHGSFLKGISVAGFVNSILMVGFTVFGALSWKWLWMAVVLFIVGFMAKNMEDN